MLIVGKNFFSCVYNEILDRIFWCKSRRFGIVFLRVKKTGLLLPRKNVFLWLWWENNFDSYSFANFVPFVVNLFGSKMGLKNNCHVSMQWRFRDIFLMPRKKRVLNSSRFYTLLKTVTAILNAIIRTHSFFISPL